MNWPLVVGFNFSHIGMLLMLLAVAPRTWVAVVVAVHATVCDLALYSPTYLVCLRKGKYSDTQISSALRFAVWVNFAIVAVMVVKGHNLLLASTPFFYILSAWTLEKKVLYGTRNP